MYVLRLEQNEMQLIQAVLAGANLNMEQSNLRGQLWQSMQSQLQQQLPQANGLEATPVGEDTPDAEPG